MNKFLVLFALAVSGVALLYYHTPPSYSAGKVTIAGQVLSVDVASDSKSQARGLANRKFMNDNQGMWFILPASDVYNFWMKGMLFPIDIIWINQNEVVDISPNVPVKLGVSDNELPTYQPKQPANRVLEVNAGWSLAHNLKVGDKIEFSPSH
ncbi:MAG TPA: DUF192 domain-containing protein [Methylomirabilota bacterium]|nr:DUF192 domain-containing protein [Methylomirabilota bacterium]